VAQQQRQSTILKEEPPPVWVPQKTAGSAWLPLDAIIRERSKNCLPASRYSPSFGFPQSSRATCLPRRSEVLMRHSGKT